MPDNRCGKFEIELHSIFLGRGRRYFVLVGALIATVTVGAESSLAQNVSGTLAQNHVSQRKIYAAERVNLSCTLTNSANPGSIVLAVQNSSGRGIPKNWSVHYGLTNDMKGKKLGIKLGDGLADGGQKVQEVSSVGLRAGSCVAWTILPKLPLQEVTDISSQSAAPPPTQ
jgi:hypothetical protein